MIQWHQLFDDRERLFWVLHTGGWFGFALVYYIGSFLHDMRTVWIFVIILNSIAGWLLTLPLRYIFRASWSLAPWKMLIIVLLASYAIAILWTLSKNIHFWEIYRHGYRPEKWYLYLQHILNSFFMVTCWSGLYFGIKNYQMLQKERQNALKASAMAHQAQVKMLRYQLNPHFLFNTLNAISTLILIKDYQTANSMVSRLSEFLRYSLDNDPIKQVPLQHEVQTLKLYLDIEKVRFESRLTVIWQISPQSEQAHVPSLILQPLIENAIKYAISKTEENGTIWVAAQVNEQRLMLTVADNGPGAEIVNGQLRRDKGVGLNNIKERLHALYGNRHSFTVTNNEPSGLKVQLTLPYTVTDYER